MSTAHRRTAQSSSRPFDTSERGLLGDVLGFAPAATLRRELLAALINLALVAVILVVFQPSTLVTVIIACAVGVAVLGRLVAGQVLHRYIGGTR